MRERFTRLLLRAAVLAGLVSLGCVDPEGEYEDFQDREKKTTLPQGSGCGDPGAACEAAIPGGLDGQWLFALASTLGPTKPILFFADVTSNDSSGQLNWQWTITPLNAKTRAPLTPLPTLPESTIPAGGAWSQDLPVIDVPGEANPLTGSPIKADTAVTGNVCGGRDFLCGDMTGQLIEPFPFDLAGSKWTLQRLTAPDTVPESIFVSCECVLADPPTP